MSRLRVLHVITSLHVGGAEMALYRLLEHRDRDSTDAMVLSLSTRDPIGGWIEAVGAEVHAIGPIRRDPIALLRLRRTLRAWRPDVVHGWMYHGNLVASYLGGVLRRRIPVLWNVRHSLSDLGNEKRHTRAAIWLGGRLGWSARAIVYNSHESARQHERLGYPADRTVVVPNGFDTDRFRADPAAGAGLRRELGIPTSAFVVGMVGRFHPVKDHASFFEAASRFTGDDVYLVLAGRGVEDSNPVLAQAAARFGPSDRVRLLGERRDMPRVNAAFDIAVSSSRGEGLPNAIGEAMACEVPCVVTDVGDSAHLVGATGLVVPAGNTDALFTAMHRLRSLSKAERAALGTAARARIASEFDPVSVVRRYEALYRDAVAESRPAAR